MMNTSKPNIINFSWAEIENICKVFIETNKDSFDCIIAITRGGWVPAVIISHYLDLRTVYPLQIYETENDCVNSTKLNPRLGANLDFNCIANKRVLIIDDIYGSGATLDFVKNFVGQFTKNIKTFVCVQNLNNYKNQYELPNYIGKKIKGWAIFPWEEEKYE